MDRLLGHSTNYAIAVGPQQGRKVFTLQVLPAGDEPLGDSVGQVARFSLHAGVSARADERRKRERLCRCISPRRSRRSACRSSQAGTSAAS